MPCPASLRHPLRYCPEISGVELRPRTIPTKALTPRFTLSEVYGCHPAVGEAQNALQGLTRGCTVLGCNFRQSIKGIAERKLEETLCSVYTLQKPFWENHFCRRAPH